MAFFGLKISLRRVFMGSWQALYNIPTLIWTKNSTSTDFSDFLFCLISDYPTPGLRDRVEVRLQHHNSLRRRGNASPFLVGQRTQLPSACDKRDWIPADHRPDTASAFVQCEALAPGPNHWKSGLRKSTNGNRTSGGLKSITAYSKP